MPEDLTLPGPWEKNRALLEQALRGQSGPVFQDLLIPSAKGKAHPAFLVYIAGQINNERMETHLIQPLLSGRLSSDDLRTEELIPRTTVVHTLPTALGELMKGNVLLQIGGSTQLLSCELSEMPHREIPVPSTEPGVSGPREAFTEHLPTNLSQLRRRLPMTDLKLVEVQIGSKAPVKAVLAYLKNRPTPRMLQLLQQRLSQVKQDGLQDVAELAEAISDQPVSVFPEALMTERPDMLAHYLKAGRVGVMLENSPRALIVPGLFMDFLSSPDDFYDRRLFVIVLRMLRLLAFALAVALPALYISVTAYHPQALPTEITLSLLAQRERTPLPAVIEAIIMTTIFEVLREAGIRLPQSIGPTVSIVGGLVIGDAAIRSGLTSPAMVLVVSATAVASFSLPSPTLASTATYTRMALLLLTSFFGFFGLLVGYLLMLANLASMSSLGIPYMAPALPMLPKLLRTATGLKPRPPGGHGPVPDPKLMPELEKYEQ